MLAVQLLVLAQIPTIRDYHSAELTLDLLVQLPGGARSLVLDQRVPQGESLPAVAAHKVGRFGGSSFGWLGRRRRCRDLLEFLSLDDVDDLLLWRFWFPFRFGSGTGVCDSLGTGFVQRRVPFHWQALEGVCKGDVRVVLLE